MKTLFFVILSVLPIVLIAAPQKHEIRMVLNVVDGKEGVFTLQDTLIGKKMFNRLVEGDENLVFLTDIGFKYIKSLIIDMNNDTQSRTQTIVIRTSDDRVIIKELPFFVYSGLQESRYVYAPEKFIANKFDRNMYYLVAYSH